MKTYANPTIGKVTSISDDVELVELVPTTDDLPIDTASVHTTSGFQDNRPYNKQTKHPNKDSENLIDIRGVPSTDTAFTSIEIETDGDLLSTVQSEKEELLDADRLNYTELHLHPTNPSFLPPKSPMPARLPGIRAYNKNEFLPPMEETPMPMLRLTADDNGISRSDDFLQLPFSTKLPIYSSLSGNAVGNQAHTEQMYVPTEIPMTYDEDTVLTNKPQPTKVEFPKIPLSSRLKTIPRKRPAYKIRKGRPTKQPSSFPHLYNNKNNLNMVEPVNPIGVLHGSTAGIKHKSRGQAPNNIPITKVSSLNKELKFETGKYHYSIQTPNSYTSFNFPPGMKDGFMKTPSLPKRREQKPGVRIYLYRCITKCFKSD